MEHNGLYVGRGVSATPSPVLFLAGGLLPRSRRAWKISAISAGRCPVSASGSSGAIAANLTVAFARIAAISTPLMNAVADKRTDIPKPSPRLRRSFASLPRNHLRRDLDSPAAARYDILPRSGCGELGTFEPLNPLDRATYRWTRKSFRVRNLFRVMSWRR